MKKIAFIPARYGSTRFPAKPLALIAGKPLIVHVYERVAAASGLDAVYVATDDERIAEAVAHLGAPVVLTVKPAHTGTDRLAEAAAQVGLSHDDLIINVQGDQPLVHPHSIEDVIRPFVENYDASFQMSTLAYAITDPREIHDPKDVKMTFDACGNALYFSRAAIPFGRDHWLHSVYKHLGVYAYTKAFVDNFNQLKPGLLEEVEKLEQLRVLENGHKIRVAITQHDSLEVDLPEDIARIEAFLANTMPL
ncbi:MAG: 3-deoxy-manno-octulosonate cytidylyltransferase [Thiotrichales bacterium]|jgi:3-deoxy-manno-octulosonate cytidylyltransferase (CMP-KDO synthetase)|nr:3-deoxy-manno-octulosonate cytidylyltransferase [Thiotrichales bacterium]